LESTGTKLRGYLVGPVKHSSSVAAVVAAAPVLTTAAVLVALTAGAVV